MVQEISNELVIDAVRRLFNESKITEVDCSRFPTCPGDISVFEDEYAVIAICAFDSVEELVSGWGVMQDHVVEFMNAHVVSTDPKAWDGYLVLIANGGVSETLAAEVSLIRTDTRRVRKLVLTAEDLAARSPDHLDITSKVRRALAPILDLALDSTLGRTNPLETIQSRIGPGAGKNVDLDLLVASYNEGSSLMESLHVQVNPSMQSGAGA